MSMSILLFSLPSITQHLSYDDCLEDNREDCQNRSVLYCTTQLCTVICTLMWAVLTGELLGFVFLCFYYGYFVCIRVSFFVSDVFFLCCCLVFSTTEINCLERLVPEMSYCVSSGTLNPTHLRTPFFCVFTFLSCEWMKKFLNIFVQLVTVNHSLASPDDTNDSEKAVGSNI